jgi:hypothetical protein
MSRGGPPDTAAARQAGAEPMRSPGAETQGFHCAPIVPYGPEQRRFLDGECGTDGNRKRLKLLTISVFRIRRFRPLSHLSVNNFS